DLSSNKFTNILMYASNTVPEFEEFWNDMSMWIGTMTTILEHYHTLAGQLLEEEDTLKLTAVSSDETEA
ncbi:MAG TPA: hypothetical protein VFN35_33450, partial [Ktedonobacteraceae bacterium]|nr:hypothetical protein [Ktedonobacteraceae bacterium]